MRTDAACARRRKPTLLHFLPPKPDNRSAGVVAPRSYRSRERYRVPGPPRLRLRLRRQYGGRPRPGRSPVFLFVAEPLRDWRLPLSNRDDFANAADGGIPEGPSQIRTILRYVASMSALAIGPSLCCKAANFRFRPILLKNIVLLPQKTVGWRRREHLSGQAVLGFCGAGRTLASFLRFWAVAARRNSSFAPFGPRNRSRLRPSIRFR